MWSTATDMHFRSGVNLSSSRMTYRSGRPFTSSRTSLPSRVHSTTPMTSRSRHFSETKGQRLSQKDVHGRKLVGGEKKRQGTRKRKREGERERARGREGKERGGTVKNMDLAMQRL